MQFKIVRHRDANGEYHEGNTVQCLRRVREPAEGFPNGKNVQRVVAKFCRWDWELPPAVAVVLTEAEREQWREWKHEHDIGHRKALVLAELAVLPDQLSGVADALEHNLVALSEDQAFALWDGLAALEVALGRLGYPRPKRPRGRIARSNERVGQVKNTTTEKLVALVQSEDAPIPGEGYFVGEVSKRGDAQGVFVARAYGPDMKSGVCHECSDLDEAVEWVRRRAKAQDAIPVVKQIADAADQG